MKAYLNLIKYALKSGNTLSVWDGEIWEVKHSTKYTEIKECIESVEEAQIIIRDSEGQKLGWALILPYEVGAEETVCDFTYNNYMNAWWKEFTKNN